MAERERAAGPAARRLADYLQEFKPTQGGVRALEALGTASRIQPWPKHSQWANYLNGSRLIPYELLHEFLRLRHKGAIPPAVRQEADRLWKAASKEKEQATGAATRQQLELDYQRKLNVSLETELTLQAFIHVQSRAIEGLTVMAVMLLEKRHRTEEDLHRTQDQLDQAEQEDRIRLAEILSEMEQAIAAINLRLERTESRRQWAAERRTLAERLRLDAIRQIARLRAALDSFSDDNLAPLSMDTTTTVGSELALLRFDGLSMDAVDSVLDAVEEQQQADDGILNTARQQIAQAPGDVPAPRELSPEVTASTPDAHAVESSAAAGTRAPSAAVSLPPSAPSPQTSDADQAKSSSFSAVGLEPPQEQSADRTSPQASDGGKELDRLPRRRILINTIASVFGIAGAVTAVDLLARGDSHAGTGPTSSPPTAMAKRPYAWKAVVPGLSDTDTWGVATKTSITLITSTDTSDSHWKNYVYSFTHNGNQRWRTELPPDGLANIIAAPNGFYCTAGGKLHSVDDNGAIRWSRKLPGSGVYQGRYLVCGRDGTVYTEANYGGDGFTAGDLLAYTESGTLKWKTRLGAIDSTPLITSQVLYVGCYDDRLYALSTADGTVRWDASLPGDVADPALINNTLVVSTSNNNDLHALTTSGKASWKAKNRSNGQYGQILVLGDLFVTAVGRKLLATDSDGIKAWDFINPSLVPAPTAPDSYDPGSLSHLAIAENTIYCVADSHIYAVSNSGTLRWSIDTQEKYTDLSYSPPLVAIPHIYVAGYDKLLAYKVPVS
ncbi:PQQ-binding-like beta-propeller repeat protein [Streptomyces pseudovenezuelae]|uniref:outer membrane protein assembly factor BamB family protein n=1 Tax=Streptomyces pseudovenezuelae TaxID=67350 RepID=UPI0036EE8730